MKNNFIIFCISIYPENYNLFKTMGLTPVGLGDQKFSSEWLADNIGDNISNKNKFFGEYSFHYWIWKNYLSQLDDKKWIGFCTYRRFWVNKDQPKINSYIDLKDNIMSDFSNINEDYDVILTKPICLKKTKISKVVKNLGYYELFLNLNLLTKKRHNLYDHFSIFHGEKYLLKAISLLKKNEKIDFLEFLKTYNFNAHNMFCVKNSLILKKFYEEIFDWLFACEKAFDMDKLYGYEVRKLGFLAELYLNFYFLKNYKVYECDYVFYDTHQLKK